ncbi:amidase domain-containing protein [Secundilactobacillus kimchicus]|uniref:amidase domain-containing protein n=1 Tax=Secundilactobacillus kimchicus TaxID=528209 RepID=UPI003D1581DD
MECTEDIPKDTSKWYCQVKYKKHNLLGIKWKTKHTRYSTSWTSVNPFWKYWTKTKHKKHFTTKSMKKIMRQARVGDIVQFASGKNGTILLLFQKLPKIRYIILATITIICLLRCIRQEMLFQILNLD